MQSRPTTKSLLPSMRWSRVTAALRVRGRVRCSTGAPAPDGRGRATGRAGRLAAAGARRPTSRAWMRAARRNRGQVRLQNVPLPGA